MLEQEEEKVEEKAADQSEAHVASRAVEAVAGSHWNDEYGPLGYGSFNCVCCNAWLLLLLLPTLFLLLVAPGLELEHGSTLTRAALALFGLCALFFCLVSNTNPGVAPRTTPYIVGGREQGFEHPGEAYSYCQDSNRYVRGFDHFCDFVGNDIGGTPPLATTWSQSHRRHVVRAIVGSAAGEDRRSDSGGCRTRAA